MSSVDYSVFDIFKLGIGPSSSHTVGPMRAALKFGELLRDNQFLSRLQSIEVDLYSSLAWTGKGHGIERALMMGLIGEKPESVDIEKITPLLTEAIKSSTIKVQGQIDCQFSLASSIHYLRDKALPLHPNGLAFRAYDAEKKLLLQKNFYSIGGGFIHDDSGEDQGNKMTPGPKSFESAAEILSLCGLHKFSISELMYQKELAWWSEKDLQQRLKIIWDNMQDCIQRGLKNEGTLPGGLKVKRRAPDTLKKLEALKKQRKEYTLPDPLEVLDWVNLFALAVNEENAAGGRVVTAPTNGAAGIIPAVLMYYHRFCPGSNDEGIARFLLTAGAIGILYKKNASISGAEVGCQGEVGVACSMAAAGLTEVLGGTIFQVENAAEIAMEHNLGLTCDPVGGLVQIPCIERNAMGAIKAINAARLALKGDGGHHVSLDKVIKTMRETGQDMQAKYKETSTGGLAVNVTEC